MKPANLLLAPDGTLKITDFGIAKRAGNETTALGVLLGTASYVSPEQVRGQAATPASDWYSFGCVLHELLAGTPPFTGPTADAVMRQHLDAPPPPVTRTDVPPELANLITHLLAKEPADRPSSAADVARLLTPSAQTQVLAFTPAAAPEDVIGVGTWEDEPAETGTHRAPRRQFPLVKVGVAAAVVLAAISGGLLLRESVTNDPPAQAGGTPSAPVQKVAAPEDHAEAHTDAVEDSVQEADAQADSDGNAAEPAGGAGAVVANAGRAGAGDPAGEPEQGSAGRRTRARPGRGGAGPR